MPDVLVRGVLQSTVDYLDDYRKRKWWSRTRASLIREILDDWVRAQSKTGDAQDSRQDADSTQDVHQYGVEHESA